MIGFDKLQSRIRHRHINRASQGAWRVARGDATGANLTCGGVRAALPPLWPDDEQLPSRRSRAHLLDPRPGGHHLRVGALRAESMRRALYSIANGQQGRPPRRHCRPSPAGSTPEGRASGGVRQLRFLRADSCSPARVARVLPYRSVWRAPNQLPLRTGGGPARRPPARRASRPHPGV